MEKAEAAGKASRLSKAQRRAGRPGSTARYRARMGASISRLLAALVVFWVAAGAKGVGAQSTGEITGMVKDASGGILPGAEVTLTHRATSQERHQITDNDGNYAAAALPAGEYVIKAELPSFKTAIREGIVLRVGQHVSVDLVLEIGDVTEQITVTEAVPLLRTTNAEVSEVIADQRLVELPLNGRQFVQLTLLSDNVFLTPVGTRGAALAQTGRQVVIGGQRVGHNLYFLDGVSITDQYFNNLVLSPSIEAIQEFKIQKSIYSAEYGGKASANVNAVIKSGSNALHGSAFEFLRNDMFDTRNFFDRGAKPPLRQNQFGGGLGGPIRKDQTFFFFNYEGYRERRALTRVFSLPSSKVRDGDFSGLPVIYDPARLDPATGRRLPFPNNRIPRERLDPVALAFLQKAPLPNLPGEVQNFVTSPSVRNDYDQFTVRIDHHLGRNDTLFGRFTFANLQTFQPYGNSNLNETLVPGFGYEITTYTRNLALSTTHVFGPNLINEVRFGILRITGGQESENRGSDFAARTNLAGATRDPRKAGFPSISFSDFYSNMGDPGTLIYRRNNSFDFFENIAWTRGPHSVKLGTYIFRLRFNPQTSPNARGAFTFSPRFSSSAPGLSDGNAFADFLLGYPSSAQGGFGRGEMDGRALWTHFYVQDDWHAKPDLTLNLGLRYEINFQMTETGNRFSNPEVNRFVIASDDAGKIHPDAEALLPLIPVPYITSKAAGYERSLQRPSWTRIAPRLGVAWSPFNEKLVVRAGFGLFYNQAAYSIQENLGLNLPFYFNKSVTVAADAAIPQFTTGNILLAPNAGTIGGSGLIYEYEPEYAESWTLGFQQMLSTNWGLQATYFGSRVVGADNSTFINIPTPGPGPVDPRRPNPNLSAIRTIRWDGYSSYHSLAVKLEKRLSGGLTFDTTYTLSKAMDDASDVGATFHEFNVPQDVRDLAAEKGLSSYDHRHRLTFTYSYDLPIGSSHTLNPKGFLGKLLSGWAVNGIGSFQTGAPITINLPIDNANIGPGPAQRPDLVRNPNLKSGTAERWFDTDAFRMPAPFTFGNAGRNIVFEAGEKNVDFSLRKSAPLREGQSVEFRAECFNLFNHTNFQGAPGRIAFTPNFGRLFNAGPSRQIQLGMKLIF